MRVLYIGEHVNHMTFYWNLTTLDLRQVAPAQMKHLETTDGEKMVFDILTDYRPNIGTTERKGAVVSSNSGHARLAL